MKQGPLDGSVRLVIFDFDGTLINSKYDIATSVNLTLATLGLPTRTPEEIFTFVGDGVKRLLRLSVGETDEARYEDALRVFRRHYLAHALDTTQLYPGLDRLFGREGMRTKALATNKSLEYTTKIVEGLKIRAQFAAMECPPPDRPDFKLKPAPDMLLRILKKLATPPEHAMLVGDSTNDVQAAKSAGIHSCAVGYGYGHREKVLALHPDYYCEKPSDLLSLLMG